MLKIITVCNSLPNSESTPTGRVGEVALGPIRTCASYCRIETFADAPERVDLGGHGPSPLLSGGCINHNIRNWLSWQ